jgi:hypothetical protein
MAPTNHTESTDAPSSGGNAEHFGFNGSTFALKLYWEPGKKMNAHKSSFCSSCSSIATAKDTIGKMNHSSASGA